MAVTSVLVLFFTLTGTGAVVLAQTAGASSGGTDTSDWREVLPGLTIGSQLRLRTESRRDFRFDESQVGNDEDFLLSRVRLGLTWEPNELVTGVVELQDARIMGEEGINQERTPNIFSDRLDVHQAYVEAGSGSTWDVPLTIRAGRQKVAYGAQRLVSSLEWVNTARVFDGVRVGLGAGTGRNVEGFATRLVPVSPDGFNDHATTPSRMFNSQFHGIYYSDGRLVPAAVVEGYWLLRHESSLRDEVHTTGVRLDADWGVWRLDAELAGQTGTYGGEDQRSMMLHVGGSVGTSLPGQPRIGAALNFGQGDDDPDDGVHRTFDNLFPLNHAFYGMMDFFALQNLRNIELSADARLPARVGLRVAYQHFALVAPDTDAWYNAGAGVVYRASQAGVSSSVGSEIDVTVRTQMSTVGVEVGYGHFFGGAYTREVDFAQRSADFFYVQTILGF